MQIDIVLYNVPVYYVFDVFPKVPVKYKIRIRTIYRYTHTSTHTSIPVTNRVSEPPCFEAAPGIFSWSRLRLLLLLL